MNTTNEYAASIPNTSSGCWFIKFILVVKMFYLVFFLLYLLIPFFEHYVAVLSASCKIVIAWLLLFLYSLPDLYMAHNKALPDLSSYLYSVNSVGSINSFTC